jgi:adhesin transport system outer membrane protein
MKKLTTTVSLISVLVASHIASAQTLTGAVEEALSTNPEVLVQTNEVSASEQQIKQAKAGNYPTLDIAAGTGWELTDSPTTRAAGDGEVHMNRDEASFIASQKLFDGAKTSGEISAAEASSKAASFDLSDISEQIGYSTISAYFNVLMNQELVSVAQDNYDEHEKVFDQIHLRVDRGVDRPADLDQIKARLSLASSNLIAAKANLRDAETQYIRVVGSAPADLTNPGDECCSDLPSTVSEAIDVAYNNHPSLSSTVANYEAANANIQVAKSNYYPKVRLDIEGSADDNIDARKGYDKDLLAMFRLEQNIYNGGADSARIKETESLSAQQEQVSYQQQRDVESEVRLSWNALQTINGRIGLLKTHVDSAEKAYDAYSSQFNLGQRTLLDLLDAKNEVFTSQSAYINGEYSKRVSCYRLLTSMGVLRQSLNIASADTSE